MARQDARRAGGGHAFGNVTKLGEGLRERAPASQLESDAPVAR